MTIAKIYKANQCTDLNDVETAIFQVKKLADGNYTPALRRRLASLESKKKKLWKKSYK